MDGAQFAKMLSDKHLFELDRMEYRYSTVSVKEFAEFKEFCTAPHGRSSNCCRR